MSDLRQAQLIMLEILQEIDKVCKDNNISYWLDGGTLLGAIRHNGFIPWDDDLDIAMLRDDYNKFISIAKEQLSDKLFLQYYKTDNETQVPWCKIRHRNSKFIINGKEKGHTGIFVDIFPMDFYGDKDFNKVRKVIKNYLLITYWQKYEKFKKPYINYLFKNFIIGTFKVIYKLLFWIDDSIIISYLCNEKKIIKNEINSNKSVNYGIEIPFSVSNLIYDDIFPLNKYKFEGIEFNVPNRYDKYLKINYGEYMKLPPKSQQKPPHLEALKIGLSEEEFMNLNKDLYR